MTDARVRPMPRAELEAWGAARAQSGVSLPEPFHEDRHEAVTVEIDGVDVGGALLALSSEGGAERCVVLVLQTTVPYDASERWTAIASALGEYAASRGATTLAAAVAPALAGAFGRAGFQATMISASLGFGPDGWSGLVEDGRVSVREMDLAERRVFVDQVRAQMHAGMARAGVVDPASSRLGALEERFAALLHDPLPEQERTLAAIVDGRFAGGLWATVVPTESGTVGHVHSLHLDEEHRGQGLSTSFLAALRTRADEMGVEEIHVRLYGYDQWARHFFLTEDATLEDVHLRKNLEPSV